MLLLSLYTQAGPDGEITAEEQVQMLLDAKLHCLHTISTHELAGKNIVAGAGFTALYAWTPSMHCGVVLFLGLP